MSLTIFGVDVIDEKTVAQMKNCIGPGDMGVLTADAHYGYAHPIGGAIAYRDKVSVSGVGFDIGCGNKAVMTNIKFEDIKSEMGDIMDEVVRRISFGMGRPNTEPVKDHYIFELIANAEFHPQRDLLDLARCQLGTVGGGNHFVDLFVDEAGYVWIGVHFGSRGFGHKTASGFIAMSQGLSFTDKGKEGQMDGPPVLFDADSWIGEDYIEAMKVAGAYAMAGRNEVVSKVLEILGNPLCYKEVHKHHNFAWKEEHFGEEYWVVRKGCTPAFPYESSFVGANMRDTSFIIRGVDSEESKLALYSTVHGAGRILSRTQAAGKKKWIKGKPTIVSPGVVDFDKVQAELIGKVILRGAGADEAPQCYKNLEEVLGYHEGTIEIEHRLTPVGVAMAGADIVDPYKD